MQIVAYFNSLMETDMQECAYRSNQREKATMSLPPVLSKLRIPVIGSPLFIISTPELVIAQCKAGVVGSFPSLNARSTEILESWLQQIIAALKDSPDAAPFAVNLIVHKSNNRLQEDLALCVQYQIPIVITSLGANEDVNSRITAYGGIVLHDIINNRFAKKAIEKGATGLIAVAAGAGGHAGALSPFALVQEIRTWFDGPLVLSGSIANGNAVLGAQAMGADLAYIGSAFIATEEANADSGYKDALVQYAANDIVYTNLFTGVHGNYLAPSIKAAGLDPSNLPESDPSKMNFGSGGESESKAWKDIWGCGQGIGAVEAVLPAADFVDRLAEEYATAKSRLRALTA
ncbi:MAG: nitronate monooxygenase [Candidatus Azotimanducaceae bacterium]|jgi:nitronate monooxygenase